MEMTGKYKVALAIVLGAALSWFEWGKALSAYFVSDDFVILEAVRGGRFATVTFTDNGGFLRPVSRLFHLADYRLWGLNPFGFHLTNVVLHLANSLMVAALAFCLLKLLSRGRPALNASLASGLIFMALPCHSEAVAWITGRTDLIAGLFFLVALTAYVQRLRGRGRAWYLLSLSAFVVAIYAKESALVLPLAVVMLEGAAGSEWKAAAGRTSVFWGVLPLYFLSRRVFLGTLVGGYGTSVHLRARWYRMFADIGGFGWRAYLPPMPDGASAALFRASVALGLALLAAVVALLAIALARRSASRLPLFLAGSFLAAILPVLSLGVRLTNTMNERYLYLPSAFAAVGLALAILRLRPGRLAAAALALYLVFGAGSLRRLNERWVTAGELARRCAAGIAAGPASGRILVLNAPDNLDGAFVLRNGLPQAVRLLAGAGYKRVLVASFHDIESPEAAVEVRRDGETFTLALTEEKANFHRLRNLPGLRSRLLGPGLARFSLNAGRAFGAVYGYDRGRMVLLRE